jgi:hypothetical protein
LGPQREGVVQRQTEDLVKRNNFTRLQLEKSLRKPGVVFGLEAAIEEVGVRLYHT